MITSPRESRRQELLDLDRDRHAARRRGDTKQANALLARRRRLQRLKLPRDTTVPVSPPSAGLITQAGPALPAGAAITSMSACADGLYGLPSSGGEAYVWDGTNPWTAVSLGDVAATSLIGLAGPAPRIAYTSADQSVSCAEFSSVGVQNGLTTIGTFSLTVNQPQVVTGLQVESTTYVLVADAVTGQSQVAVFDETTTPITTTAIRSPIFGGNNWFPTCASACWRGNAIIGCLAPRTEGLPPALTLYRIQDGAVAAWNLEVSLPDGVAAGSQLATLALFDLQDRLFIGVNVSTTAGDSWQVASTDGATVSPWQTVNVPAAAGLCAATFRSQARIVSGIELTDAVVDPLASNVSALAIPASQTAATGSDDLALGTGSFTAECWVKYIAGQGDIVLLDFTGATSATWVLTAGPFGALTLTLRGGGPSATSVVCASDATDVGDGEWHHVAAVRDALAATLTVLLDGVDVGSTTDIASVDLGATTNLAIGPAPASGLQLAELRLWSEARDAFSISDAMYHLPPAGVANLEGWWSLQSGGFVNLITGAAGSVDGKAATIVQAGFALVTEGSPTVLVQSRRMQGAAPDGTPRTEWRVAFEARGADGGAYLRAGSNGGLPCCRFLLWAQHAVTVYIQDVAYAIGPSTAIVVASNLRGRVNVAIPSGEGTSRDDAHLDWAPLLYARAEFMLTGAVVASPARTFFLAMSQMSSADLIASGAVPEDNATLAARAASTLQNLGAVLLPHDLEHPTDLGTGSGTGGASRALRRSARGLALVNSTPASHAYTAVDLTTVAADPVTDNISVSFVADASPGSSGGPSGPVAPIGNGMLLVNAAAMPEAHWSIDFTTNAYTAGASVDAATAGRRAAASEAQPGQLAAAIADATAMSVSAADDGTGALVFTITGRGAGDTQSLRTSSAHQTMDATTATLKKLGAKTDSIWDWLTWVFDLTDMQHTADAIMAVFGGVQQGLSTTLTNLQAQATTALTNAQRGAATLISDLRRKVQASFDPSGTSNLGFAGHQESSALPGEAVHDAISEHVTQTPTRSPTQPTSVGGVTTAFGSVSTVLAGQQATVTGCQQAIVGSGLSTLMADPTQFAHAAIDTVLQALGGVVNGAFSLAQLALPPMFGVAQAALTGLNSLLNYELELPVLGGLLKMIIGGKPTLLRIFVFGGAAVATVMAKVLGTPLLSASDASAIANAVKGGLAWPPGPSTSGATVMLIGGASTPGLSKRTLVILTQALTWVYSILVVVQGLVQILLDTTKLSPGATRAWGIVKVVSEGVAWLCTIPFTAFQNYEPWTTEMHLDLGIDLALWFTGLVGLGLDVVSLDLDPKDLMDLGKLAIVALLDLIVGVLVILLAIGQAIACAALGADALSTVLKMVQNILAALALLAPGAVLLKKAYPLMRVVAPVLDAGLIGAAVVQVIRGMLDFSNDLPHRVR